MRHVASWAIALTVAWPVAQTGAGSSIAEGVAKLTRHSSWKLLASVPIPFRTYHPQGDMTHNPVRLEPSATGVRGYFMPEDDMSTLYIYDVEIG